MANEILRELMFLNRDNEGCIIARGCEVSTPEGNGLLKMFKSMFRSYHTAAADNQAQPGETRSSGVSRRPLCVEFEPQKLGIILVNEQGQITEANDAFWSMSGYSEVDRPLDTVAITPVEWRELDVRKARLLAETGRCLPWQKEILTRRGHRLPVLIGIAAISQAENTCQYFVANMADRLQSETVILDYQARLRIAAVELSLSAERERRVIAGEMHDNIGQELAITKLRLSKLRAESGGEIRAELDEIAAQIGNVLKTCRTLSNDLATPALYKLGLVPALKNLIATLKDNNELDISLQCDFENLPLSSTTRVFLYRAIRELLVNIVKHAHANSVEISVARLDDMISIVVRDDGIGFDVPGVLADSSSDGGLGLFLVRERLSYIDGSVDVDSETGKGTRVTLVAPLEFTTNMDGTSE